MPINRTGLIVDFSNTLELFKSNMTYYNIKIYPVHTVSNSQLLKKTVSFLDLQTFRISCNIISYQPLRVSLFRNVFNLIGTSRARGTIKLGPSLVGI